MLIAQAHVALSFMALRLERSAIKRWDSAEQKTGRFSFRIDIANAFDRERSPNALLQ